MGKRGPVPKSPRLRAFQGNPGRQPMPAAQTSAPGPPPRCPSWLDASAKRRWRELVPSLQARGMLDQIDLGSLAAYCSAWSEFETATRMLREEGHTVDCVKGRKMAHPAVAMQRSAWKA